MSELPDWTRGMVLMGQDDDGELQVIGLDDEGRISAFIIDSRDAWDRLISVGNAELAVRLGSSVAFDRRGQVAIIENFESGWPLWTWSGSGTLAAGALDPTSSLSGGYSVKLTGGSTNVRFSMIGQTRGVAPMGRVGLEFAFALGSGIDYVSGSLYMADGTRAYRAQARYEYAGTDLEIYNAAGGWTKIGDMGKPGTVGNEYNILKFVVDQDTQKYERVLLNDVAVEPTTVGYYDSGATTDTHISIQLACYSRAASNDDVNIDDIIVTLAEPAN